MHRARNAAIIIILCIIGAVTFKSRQPQLGLDMPALHDSVSGGPVHRRGPKLTLASAQTEDLKDSVAGHAVGTSDNHGNTLDDIGPPPHGSGNGGFGGVNPNPGQNFVPPTLSQSGPQGPSNNEETFPQ